jgi:hypothetical protein
VRGAATVTAKTSWRLANSRKCRSIKLNSIRFKPPRTRKPKSRLQRHWPTTPASFPLVPRQKQTRRHERCIGTHKAFVRDPRRKKRESCSAPPRPFRSDRRSRGTIRESNRDIPFVSSISQRLTPTTRRPWPFGTRFSSDQQTISKTCAGADLCATSNSFESSQRQSFNFT